MAAAAACLARKEVLQGGYVALCGVYVLVGWLLLLLLQQVQCWQPPLHQRARCHPSCQQLHGCQLLLLLLLQLLCHVSVAC